jgi:hypothetical protein
MNTTSTSDPTPGAISLTGIREHLLVVRRLSGLNSADPDISRSVHVDASSIKQAQPPAPVSEHVLVPLRLVADQHQGAWDYRENKISVEDNALAGSPRNFADNVTDV